MADAQGSSAAFDPGSPGFALYLHWPFCQSKCPYCDFNSHVATSIDQNRWQRAYLAELDRAAEETRDRILTSVFFGGGTPSLMNPDLVAAILERIRRNWRMANQPEITLEANPGSVEAGRFAGYRDAGVNRVSIGVQALDDPALRQLGRVHSAHEARRAIEVAQAVFDRYSFDLIYARQGQSLADWKSELATALSIGSSHLSLYQLTIEEGTVFHERNRRGLLSGLPDEDLAADLYLSTQELCEKAGMPAYEVSNHSVPGQESRHNLVYWRGDDYLGIGPGAHGRLSFAGRRQATFSHRMPGQWLEAVESRGSGEAPREVLTAEEHLAEHLMMGLRLASGVSVERLGEIIDARFPVERLQDLESDGLLRLGNGRLSATPQGRLVLNSLLTEILRHLD